VPARIASWEIMGVLGRGASATIYLGRELFPARDVAIKVYDSQRLSAEDRKTFRSLFLKETLLARPPHAPQHHPGLRRRGRGRPLVHRDGVLPRGQPRALLHARDAPAAAARRSLIESCCDALSYASAHGIIHRDLKPHNILMSADGEAKVADFGVAFSNLAFDSTRAMVVGSPAYMAPEQIEGKPASMKSDMYSLGIVLYKMLVGALPFAPESPAALATRIMLGNLPMPGEAVPACRRFRRDLRPRDVARPEHALPLVGGLRRGPAHGRPSRRRGRCARARRAAEEAAVLPRFRRRRATEVVSMARWFDVRAGSQLIGEGDPGYSFFVLVRGQMRVTAAARCWRSAGRASAWPRPHSCAAPGRGASARSPPSPTAA
jgi:hypothetical protein